MVDAQGVIHLGWMVHGSDHGIDIFYKRSEDGGTTWSDAEILSDVRSRFPFFASGPGGDVIWLFWKDERHARPGMGEPQADVALRYSVDGGMSWGLHQGEARRAPEGRGRAPRLLRPLFP